MCFIVFKYFIVSKCLKHKKSFSKQGSRNCSDSPLIWHWRALRKNCLHSELFWSAFFPHFPAFRRSTETEYLSVFSPNAGNVSQNNSEYGHFIHNGLLLCFCNCCVFISFLIILPDKTFGNYSFLQELRIKLLTYINYTPFFVSNTFIRNARLKLAKNKQKLSNTSRLNFWRTFRKTSLSVSVRLYD